MRIPAWCLVLLLALAASPAAAKQPKCPLDLVTCLNRFQMGGKGQVLVARAGLERTLQMEYRLIPDDVFSARGGGRRA